MKASINTVNIKLDITPALWLADQRIQAYLPREHVLAFFNLLCHATTLTATTGSDYVDGEFSLAKALKRVPGLTEEAVEEMVEAELVEQIDGDRWAVEFPNPQTPHDQLQALANSRARGAETKKANYASSKQEQQEQNERVVKEREANAKRQQEYRDRQQAMADTMPELTPLAERGKKLVEAGVYSTATVPDDDKPPF